MKCLIILSLLLFTNVLYSATTDSLLVLAMDSIEKEYKFEEKSIIQIKDLGTLTLNNNFKFLNEKKATEFVRNYWGTSMDGPNYLGIILQKNKSIFDTSALLFTIYYLPNLLINNSNHEILEDEQLLKSLIAESDSDITSEINENIEPVKVTNWAIVPKFSKELNCLYWSEEIISGIYATKKQISTHIRFLGKNGVLAFDCVTSDNSINYLKNEIKDLITFFKFNSFNSYSETNKNENYKSIETLIIGRQLEESDIGAFIYKFWKAIFFILGICGVILFFQLKPSKVK